MQDNKMVLVSILASAVILAISSSMADVLRIDAVVSQYKKKTYDSRNRWMYVTMDNVERGASQGAQKEGDIRIRQRLSLILNLDGPEIRMDLSQPHPRTNRIQSVTSAEGTTCYSARSRIEGDIAGEAVALAKSLGTVCRVLTWPTNATYHVVPPHNHIDVDMGCNLVTLRFDPTHKQLLSADLKGADTIMVETFEFSDFLWQQELLFPRVWKCSTDDDQAESIFRIRSLSLFMEMDASCFNSEGIQTDLGEYARAARSKDNMRRASEIHLSEEQKKEIREVWTNAHKEIIRIEKKYEGDPEKREKAGEEILDKVRIRIERIKAGGGIVKDR